MLSFDITDRHIRIIRGTEARGKIKVSAASAIEVNEGLIVNGHIKDIPKLATIINDELKARRMADKEAVISISSNLVIFKELHIPKAKGMQLLTMVQNQMQHTMGIADDYSISYTIAGEVEEEGVQALKVLATACPFEVVDCFRKVFSMLGIGLRSVAVSCNTISRIILSDAKIKAKMPLLLVQIDANFISLNLYENNQLTFSRFTSIDPEDYDNSEDYIYEAVNENIFRMFQFQRSRNGDNPIQNVVFYGDTSEYIRLTNALEQMDIATSLLGVPNSIGGYENFEFQAYANAIGAMFKSNKESERINLLEIDATIGRSNAGASFGIACLAALLISGAVIGAVWAYFNLTINQVKADTALIQEVLDNPVIAEKMAAVDRVEAQISDLNKYGDALKLSDSNFKTHHKLTSQIARDVNEQFRRNNCDVTVFSYYDGYVSITVIADSYDDPANAVKALIEEDLYDNVTYTGFNYVEADEFLNERFEFIVSFDIREKVIEEPAEETSGEAE